MDCIQSVTVTKNRSVIFTMTRTQYTKVKLIGSHPDSQFLFDYKITDDVIFDFLSTFSDFLDERLSDIKNKKMKKGVLA